MKTIQSALNLTFIAFIIYVISCSGSGGRVNKEETMQPPSYHKEKALDNPVKFVEHKLNTL